MKSKFGIHNNTREAHYIFDIDATFNKDLPNWERT